MIVEGTKLDENNKEFNSAAEFVKETDKPVFLTGKAGTGKTTFLKYLKKITEKDTVILAPTGVAAINAGGQTIHSFFQIRPSLYVPNDKRLRVSAGSDEDDRSTIFDHFKYFKDKLKVIKKLELLIIDEVSMVRCDLLDVVDRLLQVFRKNIGTPFGGVQVVLIGDAFQLPPIAKREEWNILKKFYKSPFFFSSNAIKANKPIYIELKKIYRQKNDSQFIDLLNKIRVNELDESGLKKLNSNYNPSFSPNGEDDYITLATHKNIVNRTNLTKLEELDSELKSYEAKIEGTFPQKMMPTDRILQLKEEAQIMFVKNDTGKQKKYYNGKIGKIKSLEDNAIVVEFDNGDTINLEKERWDNIRFSWNDKKKKIEEEILGSFYQYPLKLAWAITVHKGQGLTFENVIADLGSSFASGQVYVALSRCTSLDGLVLKSKISQNEIIIDPRVIEFAKNEMPYTLIVEKLTAGKADFYYKKARNKLENADFKEAFDSFIEALEYRDDISTEVFKRYIVAFINRMNSHKVLYKKQKNKIRRKNSEINELKEKIGELKIDNESKEQEINNQENAIKMLFSKIDVVERKLKDKNIELTKVKSRNEFYLSKTQALTASINKKEEEIQRLRNIKWYQKLFSLK